MYLDEDISDEEYEVYDAIIEAGGYEALDTLGEPLEELDPFYEEQLSWDGE